MFFRAEKFKRQMGYSAALAEEPLKLVEDSRQRHLFALRERIGDQRRDGDPANDSME